MCPSVSWNRLIISIQKAIDFLATDIGCQHIDFLPFTQQLIPIIKFFDLLERPTADQLKVLRQYFWKTSFSNRYSTGQTNAKMDSDIERLKKLVAGHNNSFDDYQYTVTENVLKNTQFSKANPITRAFLLLVAKQNPMDLVKNQKIDIGKYLAQYNRKEYHHVFPQAFLKSKGIAPKDISCVLNFCFLSSDSNKAISKKSPSDYFFNLVPDNDFNNILTSNLLPIKKDIYKNNDFDLFKERRANELLSKLDILTG